MQKTRIRSDGVSFVRISALFLAWAMMTPCLAMTQRAQFVRQQGNSCKYSQIPLEGGDLPFARLSNQRFYTDRIFFGSLRFENLGSKPVLRVTAMADYYGTQGRKLFSVVYYAEPERDVNLDESSPPSDSPQGMKAPIVPGGESTLTVVNWMTTSDCPVRARMALLKVEYTDQTSAQWAATDWVSSAVLEDSPQFFPIPCGKLAPGFSHRMTLQLDSAGRVKDFSTEEALDQSSRECILSQFGKWSFRPALHNATPVESGVPILLRVNASEEDSRFPTASEVTHPAVIVDIFPDSKSADRWHVWFGDRPASRIATIINKDAP